MQRILTPRRNCEHVSEVDASGVLVDARDYYLAFHRAVARAQRYVLIAGWQFDSRVPLLRGDDAERVAGPARLLEVIEHAVAAAPELRFYLLAWDYSLLLALEREWMQRLKFDWRTNDRIHFVFDDQHGMGASHHQKFVVVDGALAFVGGIDLCDSRWDDRRHAPHHPERRTLRGTPQKPYHDVMAYCTGRAVSDLARLFYERWLRATGERLQLPEAARFETPDFERALPIECTEIGISLTFGEHAPSGTPKIEQIKCLHEDAIASAQHSIYIETQYFSSRAVHAALCRRMQAEGPKLEVVIVMPEGADTPKENFALGDAQRWVLSSLCATALEHGHRLRVLYSAVPGAGGELVPTFIHSKILIVDERLLSIGSANCTNRSMSLDSELNLSWECIEEKAPLSSSIARLRASLLSEHAGIPYDAALEQPHGLVARIDALTGVSKLRRRELPASPGDVEQDPLLERAFDPSDPINALELDELLEPRRD